MAGKKSIWKYIGYFFAIIFFIIFGILVNMQITNWNNARMQKILEIKKEYDENLGQENEIPMDTLSTNNN